MSRTKGIAFGLTLAIFAASWIAPRWPIGYERPGWSIASTLSPEAAESCNSRQGDARDAHADMLLATLGALPTRLLARAGRGKMPA